MNKQELITHLKQKSFSSIAWTGIELFSRQGLQFVISIILARLLAPEEFGIIGMLALFTGIASVITEGGFTSALIQKRDVSEVEASSVFYFNLVSASCMALFLGLSSHWIADFYKIPILVPLTYVMSFNLVISAFGTVQRALMTIELDFRTSSRINIIATILSSIIGIALAWLGCGVWSLAWQMVFSTLFGNMLVWYHRPWRPVLSFEYRSLIQLYRFGGFMMFSNLLDIVYTRISTLLIGKLYSPQDLGYYTRADRTQQLPGDTIGTLVGRVAFPFFAAAKDDLDLLRKGLRKSVITLMMINLPIMLGLCAISRPLVITLFGNRWDACIPYLQVLSLAGIFWPLHLINLCVLKAQGRADLFFRLEMIKKGIGFTALGVSCSFGVLAMAWSQVLIGMVCFMINAHYSGKLLKYSAWNQLRDVLPYGVVSLLMALSVWMLTLWQGGAAYLILILQLMIGVFLYLFLCSIMKLQEFQEAVAYLHSLRVRKIR